MRTGRWLDRRVVLVSIEDWSHLPGWAIARESAATTLMSVEEAEGSRERNLGINNSQLFAWEWSQVRGERTGQWEGVVRTWLVEIDGLG